MGVQGCVWFVSHHFVSSPFSLHSDDNVAQVNQVSAYPVMSNSVETPWSVALQAPLSTGFPMEEYWSGLPLPPPGDLPNPGIERVSLVSPTLQADSLLLEPLRKPSANHQCHRYMSAVGLIFNAQNQHLHLQSTIMSSCLLVLWARESVSCFPLSVLALKLLLCELCREDQGKGPSQCPLSHQSLPECRDGTSHLCSAPTCYGTGSKCTGKTESLWRVKRIPLIITLRYTLAPWKEIYDKSRQSIKKQRHYFADKGPCSQSYGFFISHMWMWELNHKEGWALKNWYFWIVVLKKTLESPLDCKEFTQSILKEINPNIHWKDWC